MMNNVIIIGTIISIKETVFEYTVVNMEIPSQSGKYIIIPVVFPKVFEVPLHETIAINGTLEYFCKELVVNCRKFIRIGGV